MDYQPFIDAMKLALEENNDKLIKGMRAEFGEFKEEMRSDMREFKEEMRTDMKEFKAEIRSDLQELKNELHQRMDVLDTNMDQRFMNFGGSLTKTEENYDYLEAKFVEHDKEIYQLQKKIGM